MGIEQRYANVAAEVAAVCREAGRDPAEVTVVAVSKTVGPDAVARALAAGARDFGENRPDGLAEKAAAFPQATWHFIGNIQSRRIPDIVRSAALVHSLFEERHARKIDEAAAVAGKVQDVLLEVNVSGEESKGGLAPGDVRALLDVCARLPHVRVRGLMTMAPQGDPAAARAVFEGLANLYACLLYTSLPHRGRRAPLQPAVGGAGAHRRQPAQLLDRVGPLRRDPLLRAQQHRRRARRPGAHGSRRAGARGDGELRGLVHEPVHERRDILGHGGVRFPHVLRRVRVHPQPRAHAEVQKLLAKEGMGYVARLTRRSEDMLDATLRGDVATMAEVIEAAHDQEVPLLRYANEADLAALVNLVYLAARDRYAVRREEPAGKGVADVTFIPRNLAEARWRPFIVELKTGGTAAEAVAQIRKRDYAALFADGLLGKRGSARSLAVGIAWDPKTKTLSLIHI